jgi:hypothetical protein
MGIRQAFTSYSNPEGNADTERFLRTLKEGLVWSREWTSSATFFAALDRWIAYYTATYLHSAPYRECPRGHAGWLTGTHDTNRNAALPPNDKNQRATIPT